VFAVGFVAFIVIWMLLLLGSLLFARHGVNLGWVGRLQHLVLRVSI
jgi:hypothetical protein